MDHYFKVTESYRSYLYNYDYCNLEKYLDEIITDQVIVGMKT